MENEKGEEDYNIVLIDYGYATRFETKSGEHIK